MTQAFPSPAAIRAARAENPKARERDLAAQLGISEAALTAAFVGHGVRRIEPRVDELLLGLESLGEVMALTRNESAVHEKIGVYDKVVTGAHNAMVLSSEIDLRIFPAVWKHGFAVEKRDGEEVRRSLQFFDAAGDAVHKIHLRPASKVEAYEALVGRLLSSDLSDEFEPAAAAETPVAANDADPDDLRDRWRRMTDVHQFVGILRELKLTRNEAVKRVGAEFAWPLATSAVSDMMHRAAQAQFPIMCFVGSRGCIQIHSGPISEVRPMGPWLNVMDPTFHLHLRLDHIVEAWAVRKPNKDGHVTSLEAYGADGKLIIQFFGKRKEGFDERSDWRALVESLERPSQSTAA
jgi:putative hemin transport protein